MPIKKEKQTKKDKQRQATRLALIEAAESLFARYGIDSVSLRQIGNAIDSANPSVVGYHFGTKEDIVQAIFEHRLPWLDKRQGELYEELCKSHPKPNLRDLLYALWYPLMEKTDKHGAHSLGGFLAELIRSDRGHLLEDVGQSRANLTAILVEINTFLPKGIEPFLDFRKASCLMIIASQLRFIDDLMTHNPNSEITPEIFFADALRMAEAAMSAPLN